MTLSEPAPVSIHKYCTLFPPNKHFTCFTTFLLCGNSFLQSWRARALSLTICLVARILRFHCCNPTFISGQEPKPCLKLLQAEVSHDHGDMNGQCQTNVSFLLSHVKCFINLFFPSIHVQIRPFHFFVLFLLVIWQHSITFTPFPALCGKIRWIQTLSSGTSLVVLWVRLHAPNAGGQCSIPGLGTRSCMHAATKSSHATTKSLHAATKDPACHNEDPAQPK